MQMGRFAQDINVSVAAFLIARGADGNSLLRLSACVGCPYNWPTPAWNEIFDFTPGAPISDGAEVESGVFRREFAKATGKQAKRNDNQSVLCRRACYQGTHLALVPACAEFSLCALNFFCVCALQ